MGRDGAIRASQQDRENVTELLRQAYADGRLDLTELRDRCGAAYAARTWADLGWLTADLPQPAATPDLPRPGCLAGQDPPRPAPGRRGRALAARPPLRHRALPAPRPHTRRAPGAGPERGCPPAALLPSLPGREGASAAGKAARFQRVESRGGAT